MPIEEFEKKYQTILRIYMPRIVWIYRSMRMPVFMAQKTPKKALGSHLRLTLSFCTSR